MSTAFVPYCGHAPLPGAMAWNTDPVLITSFCAVAAIYAVGCRDIGAPKISERCYFAMGLFIAAASLLSPLCNLSVALFSARVSQHMILTLIAAPLIALGRPEAVMANILAKQQDGRRQRRGFGAVASGLAFAVAMWTWHMPGPYDATLRNNLIYWTMHVTTFGSALTMWHFLIRDRSHAGAVTAVATGIQMGLLGALLTLAPRPLFVVHYATTWPWGLSPLQDQQLGGIIMWVPAGTLFAAYGLVAFAAWLNADQDPMKPFQLPK